MNDNIILSSYNVLIYVLESTDIISFATPIHRACKVLKRMTDVTIFQVFQVIFIDMYGKCIEMNLNILMKFVATYMYTV